ncbi:MAG: sulfurtransferase TusA family protein [Pseudomonadota bacterium]
MDYDQELDTIGLLCPLPVLKAAKRLRAMAPGTVLKMVADDPAAIIDVPHFCAEQGYRLVTADEAEGKQVYFIQKEEPSAP